MTEETKKKISKALTGKKLSKEHIESLRKSHLVYPTETRTCVAPNCSNTFECKSNSTRKYCSKSCGRKCTVKRLERVKRNCIHCGKEFIVRKTSTKKLCSIECSNAYRRQFINHNSVIRNRKISETVSQQYIDGKRLHKNGYNEGWVKLNNLNLDIYCRSSYEKDFLRVLDNFNNVVSIKSEPFKIEYVDSDGVFRHYIPDFLVEFKDGFKFLFEIKPSYKLTDVDEILKFKTGLEYSVKNDFVYVLLTEKEIYSNNNGSTTETLIMVTLSNMVAIFNEIMIQSELHSNMER